MELLQGDVSFGFKAQLLLLCSVVDGLQCERRALRLLGVSELGQVPRGLTPLFAEATKASQALQQVGSKLQPTVQHLLKIGLKPTQVLEMLENPALRPRNAAELQQLLRAAGRF